MGTNIMDIEINDLGNGNIELWFVAICGENGPRIKMPYSLLKLLTKKIEDFYKSSARGEGV